MFTMCAIACLTKNNEVIEGEEPATTHAWEITRLDRLLACRWLTWPVFVDLMKRLIARASPPDMEAKLSSYLADPRHLPPPVPDYLLGPEVHIPVKLLHGPWSSDKADFLYHLCQLGLSVDWDHSTAGEVAFSGLEEAINTSNQKAAAALLCDRVMVLPTQELLRAAVMHHGCDQTIIFHLLTACLRAKSRERCGDAEYGTLAVNILDPAIWSWLKRLENADGAKAAWLRNALTTTASMVNTTSSSTRQQYMDFEQACGNPGSWLQVSPIHVD